MFKKISQSIAVSGALLLAAGSSQAAITNLISNSGFETGDFSSWAQEGGAIQSITSGIGGGAYGSFSAELSNTSPAGNIIKQDIGAGLLTAGQSVEVSLDYRGVAEAGGVLFVELFSLDANNAVTKTEIVGGGPLFPAANSDSWSSFSFTTTIGPDVEGGLTLVLNAPCGAAAGCISNYILDNVSVAADVAAVPVPAAAWLFGSALLGLAGIRKKQS